MTASVSLFAETRRGFLVSATAAAVATKSSSSAQAAYLEPGEFRGAQSVDFNPNLPPFQTLPSGVRVLDIAVGKGDEVAEGKAVSCQW